VKSAKKVYRFWKSGAPSGEYFLAEHRRQAGYDKKNGDGIEYVDQNFDTYAIEYTFADGTKMYMDGRGIPGAKPVYNSWAHGTKGAPE